MIQGTKTSWVKAALFIIGALIAFIALVIGSAFWATYAPTEEARTFLQMLSEHKVEDAYNSTSLLFQRDVPLAQLEAFVQEFPVLTGGAEVSFSSRSVENGQAFIRGTIEGQDGTKSPIMIELVKEERKWKVLNVDLNPMDDSE